MASIKCSLEINSGTLMYLQPSYEDGPLGPKGNNLCRQRFIPQQKKCLLKALKVYLKTKGEQGMLTVQNVSMGT